jgi:hypothetical protein
MDDAALQRWQLGGDRSITGQVLALQQADANWGVGVYDPDDWNSTTDALWLLLELGADPDDDLVRHAVRLVHDHVRWEERNGGLPFFAGETEACVNGRVASLGAYFGFPNRALIDRLLGEQLADGGWNCDAPASTRSSFHSTICVLEGLLAFERATGGAPEIEAARRRGEDYLLDRGLLRSKSDRRLIDEAWSTPHVPTYWCYDVLRGLEHLRAGGVRADDRVREAVETLRAARHDDGTWHAATHPGRPVIELEPAGAPSRLTTFRALRVLAWASATL